MHDMGAEPARPVYDLPACDPPLWSGVRVWQGLRVLELESNPGTRIPLFSYPIHVGVGE